MKRLPPELEGKVEGLLFPEEALLEEWRDWRKGLSWKHANGSAISGAVDNILVRGEKLVVLDYKTRGSAPNQETSEYSRDQLNIYSFLLQKNGFETEDHAFLLFYHPDKVTEAGEVLFHTDLVRMTARASDAEQLFHDALKLLSEREPEADAKCEYCKYAQSGKW